MSEGTRVRAGRWTPAGLVVVAAVVVVLVNAAPRRAGSDPPTPSPTALHRTTATLRTPLVALERTRLARRTVGGDARSCDGAHCCPTEVRTFGSEAPIARVIGHFQGIGYGYAAPPLTSQGTGDPKTSGTYLRWLGELPGDRIHRRIVNVATGSIAERPGWRTIFEVSRAACGNGAGRPPEDWPRH